MSATSPYLNAPPRSLAEVLRIRRECAEKPHSANRRLARLLAGDPSASAPPAEGNR